MADPLSSLTQYIEGWDACMSGQKDAKLQLKLQGRLKNDSALFDFFDYLSDQLAGKTFVLDVVDLSNNNLTNQGLAYFCGWITGEDQSPSQGKIIPWRMIRLLKKNFPKKIFG